MKYEFTVTSVPADTSGYNVPACTEGLLRIVDINKGKTFFEASGVLLVEFAIVLKRWLLQLGESGFAPPDFYYASMDFEEEPIFSLRYSPQERAFKPYSVRQLYEEPAWVTPQTAKVAAGEYLNQLETVMVTDFSIQIKDIVDFEAAL